ncbi:MAG TPA: hypothetical protein DHW82_02545 [Spirochaetia bacterium]|nr:MAG: hypothetical protein A2Y41_01575 [Spirochaetes bacterium GWB1_36_13]HCL55870.1 hypothetical protein [Spirochaetia bacterium]
MNFSKIFFSSLFVFLFLTQFSFSENSKKREQAIALNKQGKELNNNSQAEIQLYIKALDTDSSYSVSYYNLGNVFFNLKDYDKALVYYQYSLDIAPQDTDALYNIAFAFYKKKNHSQAVIHLQKLLKINQKDYEAMYFLSKIYMTTQSQTSLNAARTYLKDIIQNTMDLKLKDKSMKLQTKLEKILEVKKQ